MLFSKIHNNKKPSSHSKVSGAPALLPPLKILLLQACQWINSYELVSRSQFWNYHFNIIGLRDWKFTLSVRKFNIGCGFRSSIFFFFRIFTQNFKSRVEQHSRNNCQLSHKKASGVQRHSEFFMFFKCPALHYRKQNTALRSVPIQAFCHHPRTVRRLKHFVEKMCKNS